VAKILIVDDDADLRQAIRDVLRSTRHDILEAAQGLDGLRLFEAHHPDLIITDVVMPEVDGIELMREVRRSGVPTHVIVISGCRIPNVLRIMKTFGAVAVFDKPFDPETLLAAVMAALAQAATA
jgi:CheY-like chemotaxis protein